MIFILLAIFSSTFIFLIFKLFNQYNIKPFQAIIINYVVAGTIGFIFTSNNESYINIYKSKWIFFALFIGILLLITFLLIQYSTQHIGMTITTVACKMSVVFPVMVSIFYFHEKIILSKIAGIVLALVSIFLLIKKENTPQKKKKLFLMLLPIWLFIGLGTCDSLVKIVQQTYISKGQESLFTSSLFSFSLLAGVLYGIFTKDFLKNFLHLHTLLAGIFIGLANYGSMYFLICALNYSRIDSSIVFGLVNIGIIACSLLIGSFAFKEKMLLTNKIGIFIAFISIIFMTISQWHG